MANLFDYLKGTANKVKNSALYNALTGNKDFTPLQKVEGANSAGLMPDGNLASAQEQQRYYNGNQTTKPQLENVQLDIPEEDRLATQQYIENEQKTATQNPTSGMTKWDKIMYNMGYKNQPAKGSNLSLYERLVGQTAKPTDGAEQTGDSTLNVGISENPRRGGLMNDIGQGFRENRDNGFSIDNFGQNETADGRKRGLAYHIGEGLGSLARIAESPLGRGLITAGLVGATGGEALDMLAYGGQAGALNQQNRMRDKLYRNDLVENYAQNLQNDPRYNQLSDEEKFAIKNQKYGEEAFTKLSKEEQEKELEKAYNHRILENQQTALDNYRNQIASTRGYLTDDSYKNMMNAMQLRDNAAYRKMYYDDQKEYRREQAAYQKERAKIEDAKDLRDYNLHMAQLQENMRQHNQDLGFKYSELQSDSYFKNAQLQAKNAINKTVQNNINTNNALTSKIDMIISDLENPKSQGATGLIVGGLAKSPRDWARAIANKGATQEQLAVRGGISDIRSATLVDRTGTAQTATEMANLAPMLPDVTDSKDVAIKKLKNMKKFIQNETNIYKMNAMNNGYYMPDNSLNTGRVSKEEAAKELQNRGYELVNGKWVKK